MCCWVASVNGIGANWGTQSSHPLPPQTVVKMLRDNGIQKVKLFDADYGALRALGKSGIEVMVGIPNDMLATMASSMKAADKWVAKNVSDHVNNHNVDIRFWAINHGYLADNGWKSALSEHVHNKI
ncbi:O-Glycosyl hydrolases family 17 protein [Artemisia annua]|uniref:O-Glycosyl hydrolases family 17 protein n=1 Tax=Artemisia annua TaxID=35608 RepID=A0A2U1P999_ARTAN|nr:O-Glycosyl hydrolases family 17 protein [Artemisia annua]